MSLQLSPFHQGGYREWPQMLVASIHVDRRGARLTFSRLESKVSSEVRAKSVYEIHIAPR
jgi:hypothetical protein